MLLRCFAQSIPRAAQRHEDARSQCGQPQLAAGRGASMTDVWVVLNRASPPQPEPYSCGPEHREIDDGFGEVDARLETVSDDRRPEARTTAHTECPLPEVPGGVHTDRHGKPSRRQRGHAEQERSGGRSDQGAQSGQTAESVLGGKVHSYEELRKPKAEPAIQEAQRISPKGQLLPRRQEKVGSECDGHRRESATSCSSPVNGARRGRKRSPYGDERKAESEAERETKDTPGVDRRPDVRQVKLVPTREKETQTECSQAGERARHHFRPLPRELRPDRSDCSQNDRAAHDEEGRAAHGKPTAGSVDLEHWEPRYGKVGLGTARGSGSFRATGKSRGRLREPARDNGSLPCGKCCNRYAPSS